MASVKWRAGPCTIAVLLMTAVVLIPSVWAEDSDSYQLRPQWKKGQSATYEFWTRRDEKQTLSAPRMPSRDFSTTLETTGEVTWTVDQVEPDGSSTCTMRLDWMVITLTGPDGSTKTNDSRKSRGDVEPFQELLKVMTGVPLRVQVEADGSIAEVSGVEKMRQATDQPDLVPEDLDWLESATDLATVAGVPAQLPVGGSWKRDFRWTHDSFDIPDLEVHGLQKMDFILSKVEQLEGIPVATVDGTAPLKLEIDRSGLPAEMPPLTIRPQRGEVVTQVLFDLQRREAVGRNTTQSESVEVTLTLPPGPVKRLIETDIQSQVLRISER